MAQPKTARFGKFRVLLGSGVDPIVYTAPCGLTSKSLNLSKELGDVLVPDCDDPDEVAWVARDATSRSGSISGDGVLAAESFPTWLAAYNDADSIPVKVEVEFSTGTVTVTGLMHIESFEVTANLGERVNVSISMQSDGALTITDNF